jgi:fructose-1,6-bisphosphatase II / sedoheptulose-1,7-bisphosphatase
MAEGLDPNLVLAAARVTEAAALFASRYLGCGDERAADQAAIEAMSRVLNQLAIDGTVVAGEGLEGAVEKLYIGEKVGTGQGAPVDVALNPLEGATITARGGPNAISVMAIASEGGFLTMPDIYMEKIAVGGGLPDGVVDIDQEPGVNLASLAEAKNGGISDLVVCILDRPRHADLVTKVRQSGARINLIEDGDVSGVVATAIPDSGVDIYLGVGGAPEGVLAAAALRCIGGQMQGRLVLRNDEDKAKAAKCGITDLERTYGITDLARGEVMFAATGVTAGMILRGVRRSGAGAHTHTIVMCSRTGTVRWIESHHDFTRAGGSEGAGS